MRILAQDEELVEEAPVQEVVDEQGPLVEEESQQEYREKLDTLKKIYLRMQAEHQVEALAFVDDIARKLDHDVLGVLSFFVHLLEEVGAAQELSLLTPHLIRAAKLRPVESNVRREANMSNRVEKLAKAIFQSLEANVNWTDNLPTDIGQQTVQKLTPAEVKTQQEGMPGGAYKAEKLREDSRDMEKGHNPNKSTAPDAQKF